jgi:hypothetical protein
MRIQSTHTSDERGLDAYFTCPEAIETLILLEADRIPQRIWEPAAGAGAIVLPLRATGRTVLASDIADYGLPGCRIVDYLSAPKMPTAWVHGVVTNPPYKLAQRFAMRAISEVPYVAFLVRTNFLMDAERRGRWLDRTEPTRIYYLLPRLPMMHHKEWTGKKSTSNTPFTWVVWQQGVPRCADADAYTEGSGFAAGRDISGPTYRLEPDREARIAATSGRSLRADP